MATTTEVREALEAALRAGPQPPRIYASLDEGVSPPCLVPRLRTSEQSAMGGSSSREYVFDVYAIASRGLLKRSEQQWLEAQVAPSGIEASVRADRTLGGVARLAWSAGVQGFGDVLEVDGVPCHGAIVEVRVLAE